MTGAILALFMAVVCECLVRMHKSHIDSSRKLTSLRSASMALDRLGRELQCSDQIYQPDAATIATYLPDSVAAHPFVFRYNVASGQKVVGYRIDTNTKILQRLIYRGDFDPTGTQVVLETRNVAENVENMWVNQIDPMDTNGVSFLNVDLKISTESQKLHSEVRVMSL